MPEDARLLQRPWAPRTEIDSIWVYPKVGEQYDLTTDWPHFDVTEYTRTVDFDAKYMRLDYNQKQETLRTATISAEEHVTNILSGNFACRT